MTRPVRCFAALLAGVLVCLVPTRAEAALIVELSGDLFGQTAEFEVSGSSTATLPITVNGATFIPTDDPIFRFAFLQRIELEAPLSSPIEMTNVDTDLSILLTEGSLARSLPGPTRVGLTGLSTLAIAEGETVTWSGSGTIDLSLDDLFYFDFIEGTYTATSNGLGYELRVNPGRFFIPEPTAGVLLLNAAGAAGIATRRRLG